MQRYCKFTHGILILLIIGCYTGEWLAYAASDNSAAPSKDSKKVPKDDKAAPKDDKAAPPGDTPTPPADDTAGKNGTEAGAEGAPPAPDAAPPGPDAAPAGADAAPAGADAAPAGSEAANNGTEAGQAADGAQSGPESESKAQSTGSEGGASSDKFKMPERFSGINITIEQELFKLLRDNKPLDLYIGSPDFPPPEFIKKAMSDTNSRKESFIDQYSNADGVADIRAILAKMYSELSKQQIDPDKNIVITTGSSEGLFSIVQTMTNPGDEWILIEPFFARYRDLVMMALGVPKPVSLKLKTTSGKYTSSDWMIDKEELQSAFSDKTKGIIVNSPHNPTGKVFTEEELNFIGDLAVKHNALILADDVYEFFVFEPKKFNRLSTISKFYDRTITVGSASKTFSVTGWRVGWMYGPENLIKNIKIVHSRVVYSNPTPPQYAVAKALEQFHKELNQPTSYLKTYMTELKTKRDKIVGALEKLGMVPTVPDSSLYIFVNWSSIAPKVSSKIASEEGDLIDVKFTKWLAKTANVLGTPGSQYYSPERKQLGENFIRFCVARSMDVITKADQAFQKFKP